MTVNIEALYIYDELNNCILEHVWALRPPSPQTLLTGYLAQATPRPSLLYLPDLSPPTTVFSVWHANLLFLCPSSSDAEVLAVLEFLNRVTDVLEDFLGSPLLAAKIESSYDVVAQLLGEICDGGTVCNTEPNALRENVEVSSAIGKLFTQVGLPGAPPSFGTSSGLPSLSSASNLNSGPAIPWRRPNIRHTSNELYVDIVETMSVILTPSGRPLSAIATGSILFTAKISGVPDLILTLTAPGGTSSAKASGIARTMQIPVFHPCVRLARWKERPGELSFVPPDGKFMLASYEVDLMPSSLNSDVPPSQNEKLFLPATVDMRTGLGASGCEFEARLTLNNNFPGVPSALKSGGGMHGRSASIPAFSFGSTSAGSSSAPTLEGVTVIIPFPSGVRTVTELKASRGDADFRHLGRTVQWKVPTKDGASISGTAVLTGSIAGPLTQRSHAEDEDTMDRARTNNLLGYYDEDPSTGGSNNPGGVINGSNSRPPYSASSSFSQQKQQSTRSLMPGAITASFTVRGWLPSGIKVDSLLVDVKKSKGLGEGVKPFKGVKYLTVSKQGIERRV